MVAHRYYTSNPGFAPTASVIDQVTLAAGASVWYGATLRAEAEPIEIGFGTNIQDGVTIHVDAEFPVTSVQGSASAARLIELHRDANA